MSEKKQRRARDRRDAAAQRAENAAERAAANHARGDDFAARFHERTAALQTQVAVEAELGRIDDVQLEGDQLGEDDPDGSPAPVGEV